MWPPGSAEQLPDRTRPVASEPPAREVVLRRRFWRAVSLWTWLGMGGWLVLTVGVVWFARDLDRWTVAQVPAGYWWAAQGAIGGFLVIIVLYGVIMDRLEARFLRESTAAPDSQSGDAQHG